MQEFVATGFAVSSNPLMPDASALMFECADGEELRVIIERKGLPGVLAELQRAIGGTGKVVPIRTDDLQLGQLIAVESTQVRPTADGKVQVALFAKFPNPERMVSIPMTLSPPQALALAADLQKHASPKA